MAKSVAIKKDLPVSLKGGALGSVDAELRQHDLPGRHGLVAADLTVCFESRTYPYSARAWNHQQPPHARRNRGKRIRLGLVGEGMRRHVGTSGKLFSCLAQAGVNIRMISQGASEINITVAIARDDADKALKAVHAEFIQ